MSGFHGAFATGVACQQGTLTLPDTWFRPPFWDLLMFQLLRPNSSNLPCLYSTFHLEYPLVLSRFCLLCLAIQLVTNIMSFMKFTRFICPTLWFIPHVPRNKSYRISVYLFITFLVRIILKMNLFKLILFVWCRYAYIISKTTHSRPIAENIAKIVKVWQVFKQKGNS